MSHIKTKPQFLSSRRGYQLPSLGNESIDQLPSRQVCGSAGSLLNIRALLIFCFFAFGISVSFVTGRYYVPYQNATSGCQPNIERNLSLLNVFWMIHERVGCELIVYQYLYESTSLFTTRHSSKQVQPPMKHGRHCFHPKEDFSVTQQSHQSAPTSQSSISCIASKRSGWHIGPYTTAAWLFMMGCRSPILIPTTFLNIWRHGISLTALN